MILYFKSMEASFGTRAELAVTHVCQIPVHVIKGIVDLAKVVFFALACILTWGTADSFKGQLKLSLSGGAQHIAGFGISTLGFFAPLNACAWNVNAKAYLIGNIPMPTSPVESASFTTRVLS